MHGARLSEFCVIAVLILKMTLILSIIYFGQHGLCQNKAPETVLGASQISSKYIAWNFWSNSKICFRRISVICLTMVGFHKKRDVYSAAACISRFDSAVQLAD